MISLYYSSRVPVPSSNSILRHYHGQRLADVTHMYTILIAQRYGTGSAWQLIRVQIPAAHPIVHQWIGRSFRFRGNLGEASRSLGIESQTFGTSIRLMLPRNSTINLYKSLYVISPTSDNTTRVNTVNAIISWRLYSYISTCSSMVEY
jgi:hypothetical protein